MALTNNKFGQPFTSMAGNQFSQNTFGQPFTSLNGTQTPANGFGTAFTPLQSGPAGRSYLDPSRLDERRERFNDRNMRRSMANFEMGGVGGRSSPQGGGMRATPAIPKNTKSNINARYIGGPVGPNILPAQLQGKLVGPSPIADAVTLQYGNAPSLGVERARSSARVQTGMADVGDFMNLAQLASPTQGVEFNRASARKAYSQYLSDKNPNGLRSFAKGSLYT